MSKEEVYRSPAFRMHGYVAHTVKYSDGSRRTVLVHREVMEQVIGRSLLRSEFVHHKNEDKSDNNPLNLEIMSNSEHSKHHAPKAEFVTLSCAWCGKIGEFEARRLRHNQNIQGKVGPFCGKSCAGSWSRSKQLEAGMYSLR